MRSLANILMAYDDSSRRVDALTSGFDETLVRLAAKSYKESQRLW
jgi:hypothetical protein